MTTSDAQKEIQKVDSATLESPLKPMEHNRGLLPRHGGLYDVTRLFLSLFWLFWSLPQSSVLVLLLTSEMSASSVIDTFLYCRGLNVSRQISGILRMQRQIGSTLTVMAKLPGVISPSNVICPDMAYGQRGITFWVRIM